MNINDVYDKNGQDGIDNKKAYDRLPVIMQYFISSNQKMLVDKILKKVELEDGEIGLKSLRKTSGFRSFSTNSRVGGVVDSLHLFGLAVDFAKEGIYKNKPIPVCCNLECVSSKNCWHIQFKRGK